MKFLEMAFDMIQIPLLWIILWYAINDYSLFGWFCAIVAGVFLGWATDFSKLRKLIFRG